MNYFRILCIDGGGMRGIIPAQVLIALEHYLKKHSHNENACIADYFDLFAGTSTGALLAALLFIPKEDDPTKARYSAEEALHFYLKYGPTIFHYTPLKRITSCHGIITSRYSAKPLETILYEVLGNISSNALLKPFIIPAYDIQNNKAFYFIKPQENDSTETFFLRYILRATSAAPTYFPLAQIPSMQGRFYYFVDGGLTANNPALCAYIEATKLIPHIALQNTLMLSLGTGTESTPNNYVGLNKAGLIKWTMPIFNILMSNSSNITANKLQAMYEAHKASSNYLRLQAHFNTLNLDTISMDDTSPGALMRLQEIGIRLAKDYSTYLDEFAYHLVNSTPQTSYACDCT